MCVYGEYFTNLREYFNNQIFLKVFDAQNYSSSLPHTPPRLTPDFGPGPSLENLHFFSYDGDGPLDDLHCYLS